MFSLSQSVHFPAGGRPMDRLSVIASNRGMGRLRPGEIEMMDTQGVIKDSWYGTSGSYYLPRQQWCGCRTECRSSIHENAAFRPIQSVPANGLDEWNVHRRWEFIPER